ncbi:MAG: aspartate aminotransferase family protein [Acidobacteria bacterium]|nr:aspartate aminotransferase family protein [Acidobacteriota bacterium]
MPKKKSKKIGVGAGASVVRDEARFLMNTYKRPPVVFTHGKGCYLYDHRGKKYLDFLGGIAVNALGYAHPRLVRVIRREATRAVHVSNLFHNPYQGPLARKLARWSGMERVFFTNSGTEAIEGALKLARLYARQKTQGAGDKTRILALENSFHGRTFGALAITAPAKYREPFAPLLPGVEFVRFNDTADLEAKFDSTVCALVLETIQGEGGIFPVSEAFWRRARELATQHDAALIADEIQCGLGRTGRYFAYQQLPGLPDIVVVAKPLAGGLPLGAILAREPFAAAFSPGLHGTTFGGGPLVCATALEFLTTVEEENLLANIRARGAELRAGLTKLAAKFDFIRELRGEGLILGLELSVEGGPYVTEALRQGLLINCTHDSTLRFLPPFIISARHVNEFLHKLESVFTKTRRPQKETSPAQASGASSSSAHDFALTATR